MRKEDFIMASITFNVEGMMCKNCQAKVEKALEALEAVSSYTVDHETDTALVEYNENDIEVDIIADAISKSGFPATV